MKIYKTFQSYRSSWDAALTQTPAVPLNVDIEFTRNCNLHCPFCFRSNTDFKTLTKSMSNEYDMSFGLFRRIISECVAIGVPAIKLNWRGESTMHPLFDEMVESIPSDDFHDVILNTNGNYKPELNKVILKCTKVIFSVDSLNEETYKRTRVGGDLKLVIENIRMLESLGHNNITVRRVVTEENKSEDFKNQCVAYFGRRIKSGEHICFDRSKTTTTNAQRRYCGYPSQRLVVAADGDCVPCCVDTTTEMKLGNIQYKTLLDIWNSKELKKLRNDLKNSVIKSNACMNCTSYMAYELSERDLINT